MGTHTLRSTLETNTTLQTIVIMADISSTPTNFSGKRIIVTGGSSGIGKDAALSFHAAGATVVIMSRRQEVLDTIVAEEMGGERGFVVTMDAMDNASVEAGIKEAIEKLGGGLDVLVNVAGVLSGGSTVAEGCINNYQLNTTSSVVATETAIEALTASGGNVIFTSSCAVEMNATGPIAPYAMAKAALNQYATAKAVEMGPKGVRFNVVSPFSVDTPSGDKLAAEMGIPKEVLLQMFGSVSAMGRHGVTAESTAAYMFLAADSSSFVTGQIVQVGGGGHVTSWMNAPPPAPQGGEAADSN